MGVPQVGFLGYVPRCLNPEGLQLWCSLYRNVMVAACEENDLLMFDPHNESLIRSVDAAHNDSVNCVRCVDASLVCTNCFRCIYTTDVFI